MILAGWLRRLKPRAAVAALSTRSWNRICNVLEGIEGVGCRILKTETGRGWKIIVDGASDTEAPEGYEFLGAALPEPEEEYQVLQLQKNESEELEPVWDWVRYVVPKG